MPTALPSPVPFPELAVFQEVTAARPGLLSLAVLLSRPLLGIPLAPLGSPSPDFLKIFQMPHSAAPLGLPMLVSPPGMLFPAPFCRVDSTPSYFSGFNLNHLLGETFPTLPIWGLGLAPLCGAPTGLHGALTLPNSQPTSPPISRERLIHGSVPSIWERAWMGVKASQMREHKKGKKGPGGVAQWLSVDL